MTNYLPPYYTPSQLTHIIRNGLPKTDSPKDILIAGAGMAGLVAASILKQAGHRVKIIEARSRVGGRVYTIRSPFTDENYFDAGAMRIPNMHYLVFEYINKFGLQVNPFVNSSPNDLIYVNGIMTRSYLYQQNPDILKYPVSPIEKGKTDYELIKFRVQGIIDYINQNPLKNWPKVVKNLQKYSFTTYFRNNQNGESLSPGAMEMVKVLSDVEGVPEFSFLELLREFMILFNKEVQFYEIPGGMDQLPKAFLPDLKDDIIFHQKLTRIEQGKDQVTFSFIDTHSDSTSQLSADYAIVTLPFTILQFVEIEPRSSFSHDKWKAIRELHSVPSTKTGIQFNSRFWEKQGLFGGKTMTDLPIRLAYYPSHGFGEKSGVVLGSYTWEDDALIWMCKSEEERIQETLKELAFIHGEEIRSHFVTGASHSWSLDPYATGAYTLFKPDQELNLYPVISAAEGRVHFAGEHTSLPHGWIQGAIESGIRTAIEVNNRQKG
ncbi:flavin monoamine oxidase family protein [Falsibacillus albus]|uniref:Flavin monoamine oxidase family protein n=1 Tax=Falsibacillus albus TaxID=2478915 RepID=A0A3L7JVS8_9BACI|nr:flavin monoamine oxidase family protein [Falsibacillus albus]RLQ94219.1 flavin monoamine oxidase family protein [Falsibacillus albus]